MKINKNYLNLNENYLFSDISKKIENYKKNNPQKEIIKLGIGDVTLPLCSCVTQAMINAVNEMKDSSTFKGYGPEQGYDFLRNDIVKYYNKINVDIKINEVFISDGAKSDLGNILDIFDTDNNVLIPNPVYPVYVDTNVMAGRNIKYINANLNNNFLPMPDENIKPDIIYLCSPNNPTGAVYSFEQLEKWVQYAIFNKAVILFDSAYEAFIQDNSIPHSIYQIKEAKKCAIEFCSLSKTAGFTGTRCGYTIVPDDIIIENTYLNKMWLRRQTTKFNGVAYIIQKGASAVFSEQGQKQIKENIAYYISNASVILSTLDKMKIWYTGGKNSPYIWLKCPDNMMSWDYFNYLLEEKGIVGTPGVGFGENGEGYFRLTAFNSYENTVKAMERFIN